jgi:type II secretory pathway pseudopilin PulG
MRPGARAGERVGRAAAAARRAFTLLETLLVLVLLTFLTGVLIVGGPRWGGSRVVTMEDVFWEAVAFARDHALHTRREVTLHYDREAGAFIAETREGPRFFTLPESLDGARVEFLAPSAGGSTVLIGGTLVETRPLSRVSFFPDGTCSPFRVQLRRGDADPPLHLAIDPWTCAPVLSAPPGVR